MQLGSETQKFPEPRKTTRRLIETSARCSFSVLLPACAVSVAPQPPGTQGQTGSQQGAIGSVTERFLHVLPCDVLAVRPL